MDQDEIQKILYPTQEKQQKLVDRLVNGLDDDEELSSEYDDESGSEWSRQGAEKRMEDQANPEGRERPEK